MKNVVLVSGGLDSATALAMALDDSPDTMAVSFSYGSTHERQEAEAARLVATWYEIPRIVLTLPVELFQGSKSALLGQSVIPQEEYHDIEKESPSVTVVPFRNAVMISMAVAMAASRGASQVWIANHATDSAGFAYPDCTPEFMGSMMNAAYVGTQRQVRLITPFQWMTKADIVNLAADMQVPVHHTWSCYRGGKLHCGKCPTCVERMKAFALAEYKDPVKYDPAINWPTEFTSWPVGMV